MVTQTAALIVAALVVLVAVGIGIWLADRRDARRTVAEQTTATRIEVTYARATDLIAESQRRHEQFLLDVLNRFLSRTFEEHQYAGMVGGEIKADQDEDVDHEEQIVRRASTAWVKQRQEELDAAMAAATTPTGEA